MNKLDIKTDQSIFDTSFQFYCLPYYTLASQASIKLDSRGWVKPKSSPGEIYQRGGWPLRLYCQPRRSRIRYRYKLISNMLYVVFLKLAFHLSGTSKECFKLKDQIVAFKS